MQKGLPSAQFPSFERIVHWLHAQAQQLIYFPHFTIFSCGRIPCVNPRFLIRCKSTSPNPAEFEYCV